MPSRRFLENSQDRRSRSSSASSREKSCPFRFLRVRPERLIMEICRMAANRSRAMASGSNVSIRCRSRSKSGFDAESDF